MSLLNDAKVDCVIMNKQKEPDGAGGFTVVWTEGAKFKAAISTDTSTEVRIAEAQGLKRIYMVVTSKNAKLDYYDVFKRIEDGAIFRVTSDGKDVMSPKSSAIDMSQVTAERWELTQ